MFFNFNKLLYQKVIQKLDFFTEKLAEKEEFLS